MALVNDDSFDFLFKIVLIGDCGTGKTCVVQRFKNGTYVERHGNTIGVDFSMKTLTVDSKHVKVINTPISKYQFLQNFNSSCKFGIQLVRKGFVPLHKVIIGLQMV